MSNIYFDLFEKTLFEKAGLFKKTFETMKEEFGIPWVSAFDEHLGKLFGDNEERYINAVTGYRNFAIDAMRLQQKFNKKKCYEDVSYEDACEKVYLNEDYMMKLYLPGIFVSHFLWRHHYKQYLYYQEKFVPLLAKHQDKRFYDVGTGTGFYSIQLLRQAQEAQGYGIDISPHSRRFTRENIAAWNFSTSYTSMDKDIITSKYEPLNYIQSVEVIEHLSDPQTYLNHLRMLLKEGGYGFITAALTAPNADHIYLYWEPEEVIDQLSAAGFQVVDYIEEEAYEPSGEAYVPKVAAFIIQ